MIGLLEVDAFATIVGLLNAFISGRREQEQVSLDEFKDWLIKHKHKEILKMLEQNQKTTISVKALLSSQTNHISKQLEDLNKKISLLASNSSQFTQLALSLNPTNVISEQALPILDQMHEQGMEYLLYSESYDGKELTPFPNGEIRTNEERFLQNDLTHLVDLGFLELDFTSKGYPKYYFTRKAYALTSELR